MRESSERARCAHRGGRERLENSQGPVQVLSGGPLALGPALHLPHDEQGPAKLEGHRQVLVEVNGLLQRPDGAVRVAAGRQQQRPAAGRGSQRPCACAGVTPSRKPFQEPFCPAEVAQADHGLDMVGVETPRRRLGQADAVGKIGGPGQAGLGRLQVPGRQFREPQDAIQENDGPGVPGRGGHR